MPSLRRVFPNLGGPRVGLRPIRFGSSGPGRRPSRACSGVAITRASKNVRIATVLEALDRAGLLEPSALAAAAADRDPRHACARRDEAASRAGTAPHSRWPDGSSSRFPARYELADLDAVADVHPPRRAFLSERGRPGDGRRDPASRPGQAHLPGRPGHLPHPGPPWLDRRHRGVRRGQSASDPPRRRATPTSSPGSPRARRGGPPVL